MAASPVTFLLVQLLVNHVAPCDAVYTLACVHAQALQVHGETRPGIAAGHGLLCKLLWPHC